MTEITLRKHREFWAIDDERLRVVPVTGWECPPNDYWWVPTLGYSMKEGAHLFGTEAEAKATAKRQWLERIARLTRNYADALLELEQQP